MSHYVCPACGSTSEKSAACATAGCTMVGREMQECHCTDDLHGDIMSQMV